MGKQVKFTALLDERMYNKLRRASFKHRISISMIIRQALENYFGQDNLEKILEKHRDKKLRREIIIPKKI